MHFSFIFSFISFRRISIIFANMMCYVDVRVCERGDDILSTSDVDIYSPAGHTRGFLLVTTGILYSC